MEVVNQNTSQNVTSDERSIVIVNGALIRINSKAHIIKG